MTTPSETLMSPGLTTASSSAPSPGDEVYSQLTNMSPETWPEILRERTLLAGQIDQLLRLSLELRDRLAHVLAPAMPAELAAPVQPDMPVDTVLGGLLHQAYVEARDVETVLRGIFGRLAV